MSAIALDFTNQNVVITGGTGGIGRACAEGVIKGGGRAIILDLFPELGAKACEELGENAVFYKMDQGNCAEIKTVFEKIIADFDQIHALINCAGIVSTKKFEELPFDEWERVIAAKLCMTIWRSIIMATSLTLLPLQQLPVVASLAPLLTLQQKLVSSV